MSLAEELEQRLNRRSDSSRVNGDAGRPSSISHQSDDDRLWFRLATRVGQGALLGAVRGLMAERGLRGPEASLLLLKLKLLSDEALDGADAGREARRGRSISEPQLDLLHKGIFAFTTGAVADRLIAEPGRGDEQSVASSSLLPRATFADALGISAGVTIPTLAKGVIVRRPKMVALAERFELDQRAVRRMQRLRNKYGSGPLLMRNPTRPRGHMAVVLSPEHVHRVLQGAAEPFATATFEKRAALSHFEPRVSLISHGRERAERVRFNAAVLDTERPSHRLADSFLQVLDEETLALSDVARASGELTWGPFFETWFKVVRRVVFGDIARDDHELTDMVARLRARGNWAFLAPKDKKLRTRFLTRVNSYLDQAQPGSLASVMAHTAQTDATAAEQQVPQWLFAFDPAAMATFRALALLASHPEQAQRARQEIATSDRDGRNRLPFLRACILESLRLWPTTPVVLRESTRETEWENGVMPAGTHILIYAPFFHRDGERLSYADRFSPDLWLEGASSAELKDLSAEDWPLIPFSSGPGMCPGRHLVLLLASNMLFALLDDGAVRLKPPGRLDARRPLPGTLDNYSLRFELVGRRAHMADRAVGAASGGPGRCPH